jgi:hypothetical protein
MKLNIRNQVASRMATVLIPLVSAVAFIVPPVLAQNIPAVGKPQLAGTWCPACKRYIDCPSGRMPTSCPCGYSFVQKAKPTMSPQLRQGLPRPGMPPPDAHDDRLYYDGNVTVGGLQTRHFESNGLAARAEAWGKEMKQIDEQSLKKQAAQTQAFENDKNALLNSQGNGPALQQLKNVFAEDTAWDSPAKGRGDSSVNDPNVVDLRHLGDSPGTPDLLRKPDPKQPSEYDIPRNEKTAKKTADSGDDLVLGSTLARAIATKDATVTLKPYQQEEVEKITAENGWVIAARDLDGTAAPYIVNKISGREDNPYGMHWQILLPNGESVGYFNGTRTGQDGKALPNIKSESGAQYKGVVANGKNGAAMTEAVRNVKARWEERYITDPEGQSYSAGSHNCQDFTGEVLREYQSLLSNKH